MEEGTIECMTHAFYLGTLQILSILQYHATPTKVNFLCRLVLYVLHLVLCSWL
jgi:hypothetical protein